MDISHDSNSSTNHIIEKHKSHNSIICAKRNAKDTTGFEFQTTNESSIKSILTNLNNKTSHDHNFINPKF